MCGHRGSGASGHVIVVSGGNRIGYRFGFGKVVASLTFEGGRVCYVSSAGTCVVSGRNGVVHGTSYNFNTMEFTIVSRGRVTIVASGRVGGIGFSRRWTVG